MRPNESILLTPSRLQRFSIKPLGTGVRSNECKSNDRLYRELEIEVSNGQANVQILQELLLQDWLLNVATVLSSSPVGSADAILPSIVG